MHVVVQVPAYREGKIGATLRSLRDQRGLEAHTVDIEAWVTPHGERETWAIASMVPAIEVYRAPPGKLSARNRAHDAALYRGADVIVQVDADVTPATPFALRALLTPFERPGVVASNGHPRKQVSVLGAVVEAAARVEDRLRPHLHGQFSAVTTAAWEEAGPFDETLDQRRAKPVRREEEFAFRRRVENVGEIAERPPGAVVVDDLRRHRCSVSDAFQWSGRPEPGWCARRGAETFQPHSPDQEDATHDNNATRE